MITNQELKDVADFSEAFARERFRFFAAREFLYRGGGNDGACRNKNTIPPRELWTNIFAVARVVDEIRHLALRPITTLSVYRSPAYNQCIGGEQNSFHMKGMACDFTSSALTARQLHKIAVDLRSDGFFKGGIGLYTGSNFVHVDVRGYNADW